MTWRELADVLGVEAQKIGLGLGEGLAPFLKASGLEMLRFQCQTKVAVGAAISQFAQHRTWPDLGAQDRCMLTRRLLFAEGLARGLAAAREPNGIRIVPDPVNSESALIEWALLDAWEGYELIRTQLFS